MRAAPVKSISMSEQNVSTGWSATAIITADTTTCLFLGSTSSFAMCAG